MPDTGRRAADLSMLDSLTGLWNRRALLAALRARVPSGAGALILLDLDNWRPVARRIGSDAADRVLLDVAGRLLSACDPDPLLYRYAGDAFALLLPDADRDRGAAAAEALRAALAREAFSVRDRIGMPPVPVPLTASAAVAAFPADARSPATLVEAVERGCFVAKRTGRNRVAVAGRYDPSALAEVGIFRGLPCPVFVGRAPERSHLQQLATVAREVGPSLALVTGPPGIGKSRLLHDLARWARAERFVVLPAACHESRAFAPYAALIEQVERLFAFDRARTQAAVDRLSAAHRAALSALTRAIPAPADAGEQDARGIFDAWSALLDELAKAGPLLVTLDEVEHADEGSIEVYRAAVDRRAPLLLAAASELAPADLDRTPAGEFFRDRHETLMRLSLGPLAPEEVRQVLSAILPGADVSADSVERVVAAAHGNPLYVEETVRALLLRGRLRNEAGRWALPALDAAELPRDLEAAVNAVAAALPAGSNALLSRAAAIGTRVDAELLQEVLGFREAEALDVIDEARRARLLVAEEGEEDVLLFPAAHARRARLDAVDESSRREIHGRVGVVQEARFGGDTAHLADELAYHYGRAGEDDRARHFDAVARQRSLLIQPPKVRGARKVRVPAIAEAVPPEGMEHALAFCRHFGAAVRIRRLYPQWSTAGAQALDPMRAALAMLFTTAPGLTLGWTAAGATINGQPATAVVATEAAALLEDRLVESMTFARGFDVSALEKIVDAFVEPFDRVRAASDHWERFLSRVRLDALDIVQRAFEAHGAPGRTLTPAGDKPVPPEHLGLVRDALRGLKAATDNLRLYPPGHQLVEESASAACRTWREMVAQVPAVALGTAEGDLVINTVAADRKYFGEPATWLAREIDSRELKSLTAWSGVGDDEVRALVSALSMTARELRDSASLRGTFRHIAFGATQFERAVAGEGGGATARRAAPPPRPLRAELRARTHLARPYERLLTFELEQELHVLVEALTYGASRPLAEQLVDRLAEHFHDKGLPHRRQSLRLLEHSLAYASPGTRKLLVERTSAALRARLAEDTLPLQFQAVASVLTVWTPAAVTSGCLRELADVASETLRKRADAPGTAPEIRKLCEAAIAQIGESRSFDRIVGALRRSREEERRSAIDILMALGATGRRAIVASLIEEPEPSARRALAGALAGVSEALSTDLAAALAPSRPEGDLMRLLEAADALQAASLAGPIAELVGHPSPAVKREVVRAAKGAPKGVAVAVVKRLMAGGGPEGIALASELRLAEIAPEVGRILEQSNDESMLVACCAYFAAVPNAAVVPSLAGIANARPRLFGLVKGYAAATRAAAVTALAAHGGAAAQEARAMVAADPEVRALARL